MTSKNSLTHREDFDLSEATKESLETADLTNPTNLFGAEDRAKGLGLKVKAVKKAKLIEAKVIDRKVVGVEVVQTEAQRAHDKIVSSLFSKYRSKAEVEAVDEEGQGSE